MDYRDYNDNELIMYINEKNEDASEIMFKKYQPVIKECATKLYEKAKSVGIEFNDLMQEGMLGLSSAIDNYSEQLDTHFYTFAKTCIKRKMISYIGRLSCQKQLSLNSSISYDFNDEDAYKSNYYLIDYNNPEKIAENNEIINIVLKEANNKLSNLEKNILKLRLKGYNYKEISKYLNKECKAIDNAVQRIRMKLKNTLQDII